MKKILLLIGAALLPLPHLSQTQSAIKYDQETSLQTGTSTFSSGISNLNSQTDAYIKNAPAACLTAPNGQYPTAAFTPSCTGIAENITSQAFTGEYSVVNVRSGVAYTFSVSNPAYYITISNDTGTAAIATGTASVVWTATFTGMIRFYSHADSSCGIAPTTVTHSRAVKCGVAPVEPDYGCDQTYTGVPDIASNIIKSSTFNFAVANDFFVPMEGAAYNLQSITVDLAAASANGAADISSFNIKIMSNGAGDSPGTIIHTLNNVAPASITLLPNTFVGFRTFAVKLNLGNYSLPVNATSDTRYWISLQATSATNSNIYWIGHQYTEGWKTKSNYISEDGGVSWTQVTSDTAPGKHYDSNITIDADCAFAAVNDADILNVSFYPNPVSDYLTLISKTKIETVHIYNVSGQKMSFSPRIENSRLNMSKLTPGIYIVSLILPDGSNESFKVIKK